MQWRYQPGGYLKEILTARVYDVAVRFRRALDRSGSSSHVALVAATRVHAVNRVIYSASSAPKQSLHGPGQLLECCAVNTLSINVRDLKPITAGKPLTLQVQTPLERAVRLSEEIGNTMLLKREDMQPVRALGPEPSALCWRSASSTGWLLHILCFPCMKAAGLSLVTPSWVQVFSFKLRGAYNKMASLTPEQRAKGVICSSAGNHAQGVALAAGHLVRPFCLSSSGLRSG